MSYSTSGLSIAVAQKMLAEKQGEKSSLEHKKGNVLYAMDNVDDATTNVQAQLAATNTEMSAIAILIAAMTEGAEKKTKEREQSRLNTQKLTYEIRLSRSDGETLVDRQHDLAIIDLKITEKDALITALEARIAEGEYSYSE